MSYTVDNVDILRDISANSITFKNSDTTAFIGCVHDSTYYTPNNTFVDFDFSDKSSSSNKRPLLINPWSDGASGGVVIGSRDASYLKGFSGGNYMLDVNGMIKCSTPATASNDTSVATTAFVKAQSYLTSVTNVTGTAANVTGTVAIANGGTGATTSSAALTNLGAYASSNPNGYITSTSLSGYATETWVIGKGYLSSVTNITGTAANVTGTVAIANGGTGATTNSAALTNLGVKSIRIKLTTENVTGKTTQDGFNGYMTLSSTYINTSSIILATMQYNGKASLWTSDTSEITVTILNQSSNSVDFAFRTNWTYFNNLLIYGIYVNILIIG